MSYTNYDSFVNNKKSTVEDQRVTFKATISNRKTKYFSAITGVKLGVSKRHFGINSAFDQIYYNTDYFVDVEFYLGKNWVIATDFSLDNYSSVNFENAPLIKYWTVNISKLLFKEKLELRLVFKDILNENIGYERTGDLNSISERHFNNLGRLIMLGVHYRIGKTQKDEGIHIEFDD